MLGGSAAFGLVVGSFLNVVIYRLPAGQSVVRPRSRCPRCSRAIPWHENVPVLSWILLLGKCRGCRTPISLRYPLVEMLTGGLFVLAAWLLEVRDPRTLVDPHAYARLAVADGFLAALVALSFIDLDHRILPDALTKPGMAAGAIASALLPVLQQDRGWLAGALPAPGAALALSVLGMIAGYASLWIVAWAGTKAFGRDAMGLGDAKLLAMIGAFSGPRGVLLAAAVGLALGVAMGLLHRLRTGDGEFPFGPALAAGGAVAVLDLPALESGIRGLVRRVEDPRVGLAAAAAFAALLWGLRARFPRPLLIALGCMVALFAALHVQRLAAGL